MLLLKPLRNYFYLLAAVGVLAVGLAPAPVAYAADVEKLHFLIPGGAGGGWDGTARGTGEALTKAGILGSASYENMSGGGGGKAIGWLIENADSSLDTLMVNSTPIIIRSLTKRFPQNFRDLTPIAGIIGDYQALFVNANSDIQNFDDLLAIYKNNPKDLSIAGGSVPGSMDHLSAALAFRAGGADPTQVKYLAFDAGGEVMAAILSGEADAGVSGFSEAVELAKAGKVRIVGVTSEARVPAFDAAPTFVEQGYDATFINWRGFFAAPGLPQAKKDAYINMLGKMYDTPEWEAVRARNGWVNIYNPGDDFITYLENQEQEISKLMQELGFL